MADDENTKYPTWKWIVAIAVLMIGFLVAQGVNSINAKISDQASTSKAQDLAIQAVCDRVTKLEANYTFIASGIGELKTQNKAIADALSAHEKTTREKGR